MIVKCVRVQNRTGKNGKKYKRVTLQGDERFQVNTFFNFIEGHEYEGERYENDKGYMAFDVRRDLGSVIERKLDKILELLSP